MKATPILLFGAAILATLYKLFRNPGNGSEKVYKELGKEKNKVVDKEKEIAINEAKQDHDDAVDLPIDDWVDGWIGRDKPE